MLSMRDLYPDIPGVLSTEESVQPDEATLVHMTTDSGGAVVTPKHKWSMFGVILAIVVLLIFFGYWNPGK